MLNLTPNYTNQRNKIVKTIANLSQKKFDKLNEAQTRNFLIPVGSKFPAACCVNKKSIE